MIRGAVGCSSLLLKARAGGRAGLHSDRTVVRAGFGEGAIAPAMRSMLDIRDVFGKGFVRKGWNVHFLGANVTANVVWLHRNEGVIRDARLCNKFH